MKRHANISQAWYLILRLSSIFVIYSMIVMTGCAQDEVQKESTVEPVIPAYFSTYIDETSLFSISCPSDWEINVDEESIETLGKRIDQGLPIEEPILIILYAGLRVDNELEPTVNISIEPLPPGDSLDENIKKQTEALKILHKDYHEYSRLKTIVDGEEAVIINWASPGTNNYHILRMTLVHSKNIWVVTCTPPVGEFSKWEDDFNAIVRSLHILR